MSLLEMTLKMQEIIEIIEFNLLFFVSFAQNVTSFKHRMCRESCITVANCQKDALAKYGVTFSNIDFLSTKRKTVRGKQKRIGETGAHSLSRE